MFGKVLKIKDFMSTYSHTHTHIHTHTRTLTLGLLQNVLTLVAISDSDKALLIF